MEIETERKGTVLIAKTVERVDGINAREFHDALQAVIGERDGAVVLDFERLNYIGSAGLGVILIVAKRLQKRDARITFCSLSGPVRKVFEISGFDRMIPTYDSQADAVAGLTSHA